MNSVTLFRNVGKASPLWRFVAIVAVFLLVWPAICGALLWMSRFNDEGWVSTLGFYLIYTYPVMGPSAVLAGTIHAVAAVRFSHNSILVPIGAAVASTALILAFVLTITWLASVHESIAFGLGFTLFLSLIASLICWRLTRRFARTT